MTCIPGLGQPNSIKKLHATRFKVEENSRTFEGLAQKFKDFSSKSEFQGLFETVQTLSYSNERRYDRVRRIKEL